MSTRPTKKPKVKNVFLKIIVIGDSGVGKTSLIYKYFTNEFRQSLKATLGADFFTKEIEITSTSSSSVSSMADDIKTEQSTTNMICVTLQLWDTAGQERFSSLGSTFYRGANACILVYDIGNRESFLNIDDKWKDTFLNHCSLPVNTYQRNSFPFLLIGNKTDLSMDNNQNPSNMNICLVENDYRQVSTEEGQKYAERYDGNMIFLETNAVTGLHLERAIEDLMTLAADANIPILPSAANLVVNIEEEEESDEVEGGCGYCLLL